MAAPPDVDLLVCRQPLAAHPHAAGAGYALAAFIPICILCVIPVDLARWIVVGVATLTSGTCIMLSLRRPIHESLGAKALPLYCTMIALHAGLGLALRVYFFSFAKV